MTDWRLAEVLAIHRLHGADAALWLAERRAMLMLAGDAAGTERFGEIAVRLEEILTMQQLT